MLHFFICDFFAAFCEFINDLTNLASSIKNALIIRVRTHFPHLEPP